MRRQRRRVSKIQGKRCDKCGLVVQGPPSTRSRVGDKQYCHRPGCREQRRKDSLLTAVFSETK